MGVSFSPNVQPDTHSLALGLATFGNAVSHAMDERNEEEKKKAQLAKTLRSYAAQAGILTKEQAEVMGAEELQGTVQATHFKQGLEEERRKAAQAESMIRYHDALAEKARQAEPNNQFAFDPTQHVKAIPGRPGLTFVQTSKGGGQLDRSPEAVAEIEGARQGERVKASTELDKSRQAGREKLVRLRDELDQDVTMKWDPKEKAYSYSGPPEKVATAKHLQERLDGIEALETAKKSGKKTVRVEPDGSLVFNPWTGGQPIDDVIGKLTAAPVPTSGPAPPPPADKVIVMKDGKQFRLPRAQLEEASRQGYTEVKPAE